MPVNFSKQAIIKDGLLISDFHHDLTLSQKLEIKTCDIKRSSPFQEAMLNKREDSNVLTNNLMRRVTENSAQVKTNESCSKSWVRRSNKDLEDEKISFVKRTEEEESRKKLYQIASRL